jgi:hypothetical protein
MLMYRCPPPPRQLTATCRPSATTPIESSDAQIISYGMARTVLLMHARQEALDVPGAGWELALMLAQS